MTLKLTLFSQEVEDFVMEIKINADATFYELHQLILKDCNYAEKNNQCFLICDEDWRVKEHIRLFDNGKSNSEEDIFIMKRCRLGDFLEDEGQRFAYLFDPEEKRLFLMELTENIFGHPESKGRVSRKHGIAPEQNVKEDFKEVKAEAQDEETGENFYGEDGFEDEELDMEGFGIEE